MSVFCLLKKKNQSIFQLPIAFEYLVSSHANLISYRYDHILSRWPLVMLLLFVLTKLGQSIQDDGDDCV